MSSEPLTIKSSEPPDLDLPQHVDVEILVLPVEIAGDGKGLYPDSALGLVKELRQVGISADYQHRSDSRSWIGEKGFAAIVLSLVVGITSNAGWAAICRLLGIRGSSRVHIKIARCTQDAQTGITTWEWFEIEGSGAESAAALADLGFAVEQQPPTNVNDEREIKP